MMKNDILYTKQCIEVGGALFDLMPVAAGSKNGVRPLKSSDPVLLAKIEQSADSINTIDEWTRKYGGYNSSTTAYFSLVRYKDKKGKPVVSFIPIAIIDTGKIKTDAELIEYCREQLQLKEPESVLRDSLKENGLIAILKSIRNLMESRQRTILSFTENLLGKLAYQFI